MLMSINRKLDATDTLSLPENTRQNHYLIAEFSLSAALINRYQEHLTLDVEQPYHECYTSLAEQFFNCCKKFELANSQFIANDKLARVRYNQEMHQWQTCQQILFYYNPSYHELQKSFFDGSYKAKKITLLFLASGQALRTNSASFHQQVKQVLDEFADCVDIDPSTIRLRDHQRLTYDLFARNKGTQYRQLESLQSIMANYRSSGLELPSQLSEMTYVVATVPITNHLLNIVEVDEMSETPYNRLYSFIANAFAMAVKHHSINNGAMVANGLVPLVRYCERETVYEHGELQILGYNPYSNNGGLTCRWEPTTLVDDIQIILPLTNVQQQNQNYYPFIKQVEGALKLLATELEINPKGESIIVRFHQHIAYSLSD
ncbi:DUF3083 family protein [Endozoicomonas sp. G2_1]|uniref:DUF3083 family protein n=1 Tax=Endozoicomonas sp. G2_1 TaxID=2821091 RepID=UPI001ADCAA15|nr:DUF3083 family protein [Endozoicomonas sp. G2_1]MBO9489397.1 DUF3083 family protein [Endozoicomonas sp. G2_1]